MEKDHLLYHRHAMCRAYYPMARAACCSPLIAVLPGTRGRPADLPCVLTHADYRFNQKCYRWRGVPFMPQALISQSAAGWWGDGLGSSASEAGPAKSSPVSQRSSGARRLLIRRRHGVDRPLQHLHPFVSAVLPSPTNAFRLCRSVSSAAARRGSCPSRGDVISFGAGAARAYAISITPLLTSAGVSLRPWVGRHRSSLTAWQS